MNATMSASHIYRASHYLSRQLVLTRDDCPFGSEIRIQFDDSQAHESYAPAQEMNGIYSEVLMQTRLIAFSLQDHKISNEKNT